MSLVHDLTQIALPAEGRSPQAVAQAVPKKHIVPYEN